MKKSVLRSIKPYWVYLILKGIKTVEVGKQKPKSLDWDGRVFIYCSKDKKSFNQIPEEDREWFKQYLGKVVAVFDCNTIQEDNLYMTRYQESFYQKACLSHTQVKEYGQGKMLYGWHISNLKVFDIPKALNQFCTYCFGGCDNCEYQSWDYSYAGGKDLICTVRYEKPIKRPPQSYCFIIPLEKITA